jgi:hypothetical protein
MGLKLQAASGGSVELIPANTASALQVTVPAVTGNAVVSTGVSASTTNTVTNKIAININGTVYYLLASTSGA